MDYRSSVFGVWVLVVAACSVLNAPEDLQPVQTGGASTAGGSKAGKNGGGDMPGGGTTMTDGGTTMTNGGMDPGSAGEGGAPPIGRACDISLDDCGSSAPICDATAGECRACASDAECQTELAQPYCLTAGRCGECRSDDDCSATTPICNSTGRCRACSSHDECESQVCDVNGSCAESSATVYALAETGDPGADCGTIDAPCYSLSTAAMKLTAQRNNLVLIKTASAFTYSNMTLPAIKGLKVIGNGVTIKSSGLSTFRVPSGAEVTFDNVVIEGSVNQDQAGIECTGADITVTNSNLHDNASAVRAVDCDVTVTQSVLNHNANPYTNGAGAVSASCTTEACGKRMLVTRNRFIDNGVAIDNYGQTEATVENNLFLRNGADGYTRVMELRATHTRFAYNTLVENFNGCTYVGIVACIGTCDNIGNISFKSFPAEMPPCYDQVWYNGTLSYSLSEITYPGTTNKVGDPLFVDAANGDFTPGPGSPALDSGNPSDAPDVDLDGNPRGDAPDMGAFEAQ